MNTNLEAARSGDRRRALEALRDVLAGLLDDGPPGIAPQVAAQYRATLADLADIEPPRSKSAVDELKERRERAGRRTTSDASANA